jgi:hypothetical protein
MPFKGIAKQGWGFLEAIHSSDKFVNLRHAAPAEPFR